MKIRNLSLFLLISGFIATTIIGCKKKPTDAELKTKVEAALANPQIAVEVKECEVTLSGEVADDAAKTAAATSAKAVECVKSVANNLTTTPPPAPVEISADGLLNDAVNAAIKTFAGVKADIKDGVVTLTGDINKTDLRTLMPTIMALKPKKVLNNLTVK